MTILRMGLMTLLMVALANCAGEQSPPPTTIAELMISRVTPSSDTLWSVDSPQSDEDWAELNATADEVIAAFEQVKMGGAGPDDNDWAREAKWQAYADEVIAAGWQAKDAIASRNVDALYDAGSELYPPCENCHLDYHPGMQADP